MNYELGKWGKWGSGGSGGSGNYELGKWGSCLITLSPQNPITLSPDLLTSDS
ncbi:MAG: hypothetical protein GPI95_22410 [Microcystis aeruginosa LG13-11]|nr:hypothetical protein [Microcystis aeruginosa LG13-11]